MKKKVVRRTASSATPEPAAPLTDPAPLDTQEIAALAHAYWEARGGVGGSPESDWFRAVEELRRLRESRLSATSTSPKASAASAS